MTSGKASLIIILSALLVLSAYSHTSTQDHGCGHKYFNEVPQFIDVDEAPLPGQNGRKLATSTSTTSTTTTTTTTTTTYPNIRIMGDYSLLTLGTSAFITYIKTQLMPPVISYFENAIFVKQALTSPLKLSTAYTTMCGYTTPSVLFSGATTDLYLLVTSVNDTTSDYVASAGSCFLSSTSYRPIIARMLFNLYYTTVATNDVMTHEMNTYLTIHEMFHALGFSVSNFPYFIDSSGNLLTNATFNVTIGGATRLVLDVEPLTTNLRNFYGCTTVPGAIMENDGGAGTYGSHFERRYFLYEVMTSGEMDQYRVSNFSLNVLEGSGWYVPNYTYAEPFYFGQGEGCTFLSDTCSVAIYDFSEYCNVASQGCSAAGRGGGTCASDTRSDGCYYMYPTVDYDCDNSNASTNARFPALETYGRGLGSKCFTGNLSTSTKASTTSFCFKYTCSGSGLTTALVVTVGSTNVTCKAEGTVTVSGYNGVVNCPDPLTFCSNAGKKYCPRGCMGRGTCVNNTCVCNSGFTGIDCALTSS